MYFLVGTIIGILLGLLLFRSPNSRRSLLILLCLFAGCAPVITSGRIVSKTYYPAYETEESVEITSIQVGDISVPIYGTETVRHPERWEIVIENEINGQLTTRNVDVDKSVYDSFDENDWIDFK